MQIQTHHKSLLTSLFSKVLPHFPSILHYAMPLEPSHPGHPGMPFEQLLPNNSIWAADVLRKDPHFFETSAQGQSPKVWLTN
jgi:hypothetical protein